VTRHSGSDGPTFGQILVEIRQHLEELGRAINDLRRALGEVQSIHEQSHRAGAESDAGPSGEAATKALPPKSRRRAMPSAFARSIARPPRRR
jgi:hypothetical protein